MNNILLMAALSLSLAASASAAVMGTVGAQVAGSTARVVTRIEVQAQALGWSVKKSILGKMVYTGTGDKIGTVLDLIISPDKTVPYLVIGAGGFIGMGRHDVAFPVAQVKEDGGKLVLDGATRDSVKAMPAFEYATDERLRDQFAAQADQDIAAARAKLTSLDKQASAATADAKAKLDAQTVALKRDLLAAEAKLADLRKASAAKWKAFEAEVSAATLKLRKSINAATR